MLYKEKICEACISKGYQECIKRNCIKGSKIKSLLGVIEKKYYDINKIFRKIDCIIAPSNFIERKLKEGKLKYTRMQVLHNFVNKTNNQKVSIGDYVFYFGRLSIEKGINNLIKAVSEIPNIKLYIAGSGPEKENIQNYIQNNKLKDKIKLLGYLNPNEIRTYIAQSRFVIIPSIWYENCPYSVLETMEIGKALIGSNIGGIPELIENNKNGYLYNFNDINMLKEKIIELFNNEKKVIQFSKKSRELYELKYTSDEYYNKLINLYCDLIKEKKYSV